MARYKGENRAWEGAARLLANPARGREGVRDPLSTWPRLRVEPAPSPEVVRGRDAPRDDDRRHLGDQRAENLRHARH